MVEQTPFWQAKRLEEMSDKEWESICDGCAKCCLHKFIDDDDSELMSVTDELREGESLVYSNIVCSYLNTKTCDCTCYTKRRTLVPDCVKLTQANLDQVFYMPTSCSYRRLQEGRGLPSWHPLLNKGKKSAMHKAGMSVRGKVVKDEEVGLENFEDHIVDWPDADLD